MTSTPRPRGPAWRRWALVLVVLVTLGTAAGLLTLTRRPPAVPASPGGGPGRPAPDSDRLYLSGLDYSAYDGAEPVFRLRAKELIHRRRKFGPFTVNPVKEVELRGVRIELFPRARPDGAAGADAAGEASPLDLLLQGTLASKNLGFVSRVILRDLEIDDRRAAAASHLTAREALWQPGDERLRMRGPFEIRDAAGIRRGSDEAVSFQGTTWKTTVASPR